MIEAVTVPIRRFKNDAGMEIKVYVALLADITSSPHEIEFFSVRNMPGRIEGDK